MSVEVPSGFFSNLSELVGVTEPAIKLLLTVLAGYPLALIHRKFLYNRDATLQHLYFITCGFLLGYWNYGIEMLHCMLAIFCTYCTLTVFKGTTLGIASTFVFNLGYLLIGYYFSSTDEYDINWTMPFCILVLRLIAVAYDLFDGSKPEENLSAENKKVALKETPSILEFFGHSLFPASFLVGPQFSMKRYQDFVAGNFCKKDSQGDILPADCIAPAINRFLLGVMYLIIFQLLGMFVSDDLMWSDGYGNMNVFKKMLLLGMWGRFTLYKYISCWLLTEGACIMFGLSHNGTDKDGKVKWNGVENVKLAIFENTTEFNHYIQSFNTNTNHWVAQYVFKRLKFLGNRHVSHALALLFLAVWHGFHTGYYVCFFFEFAVIYAERDVKSIVNASESLKKFFSDPKMKLTIHLLLRIYTFVLMGWCLLPFALLEFGRYWKAFTNVNYIGILMFVMWPIVYSPILRFVLVGKQKEG